MTDLGMYLSPHFTLAEMCASQTATRLGIENVPNDEEIAALRIVCARILEPVRTQYRVPFSPNSGYRCLALNRALKSKDTSQHVRGQAVDLEVPGVENGDLAQWIADNLEFDQLILEFHTPGVPTSGWVHCSVVPDSNRGEILTIGKTKAGVPFTSLGLVR